MRDMEERDSFVMYGSFLEAGKVLNGDEFKEYIFKLGDYAMKGIDVSSDNPFINALLMMAKPNLKAAGKRYTAAKQNGPKGGEHG